MRQHASQTAKSSLIARPGIARRCERAVVTAYRDLRQHGTDDMAAFQACTALYRIHHPEASLNEARRLVAEWVDQHVSRAEKPRSTAG